MPAGRPRVDITEYYEKIKPYLQRGCSVSEACGQAGVPVSTVTDRKREDPEFSAKIENDQNIPIVMARKVWIKEINNGNYQAAKDYLERKRKDEFSLRTENKNDNINKDITPNDLKTTSDEELLKFINISNG